ncbi:kinase-like domain-containing protein [Boletus reticuloceps]|uniref:Altered inheritance of mitochondria protein 9, mitochondrial n=1 Tax=Boletus reticuloceps TaxID=495285 RepID=A0A8I3A7S9_9AGAM|nr:kinase-like domain-containing protein [Boletus reticuloceps]
MDAHGSPAHPDSENVHLFQYTSGRWIYNEQEQKRIRYTSFDIDALKRIAAGAAGANHCVQMVKRAEGSFNKIFLLTFNNDTTLIAKIPCPLVAPRRLCTASEVATMDYARTILGLPVPRVLSWSADADASGVGTEYILMEHMPDRELFYKEDVSTELQQRPLYAEGIEGGGSDRFRIGPCVDWDIWRGERSRLNADRGPWPDTLSYIRAIVDIEKQWLSTFAVPRKPCDPFCRPDSGNAPDAHVRLLDDFLAVIPSIIPPDILCIPVLWHIDLHASNILVPCEGSSDIIGLIDWQGMSVRPLFLQATFAACVRYDGDDRITIHPGALHLKEQMRLAMMHKYYELRVMKYNHLYFASQVYPHTKYIIPPILSASRTWYEGMHRLRQVLLDLQDAWEEIAPGTPFPIEWDANEIAKHWEAYPRLKIHEERVQQVVERLQLEGDGWVTNERYEKVREQNEFLIRNWNPRVGPYPFQEGGWSWFLS